MGLAASFPSNCAPWLKVCAETPEVRYVQSFVGSPESGWRLLLRILSVQAGEVACVVERIQGCLRDIAMKFLCNDDGIEVGEGVAGLAVSAFGTSGG